MMLHQQRFSLNHAELLETLADSEQLLLIQDLDGVCMGLVRDPLTRTLEQRYLEAARALNGHFYVLTNGEHIGSRGINPIVERSLGSTTRAAEQGYYLPGLAGGGVQLQNRQGAVSHPGVSEAELQFLKTVPERARQHLLARLSQAPYRLSPEAAGPLLDATILDNRVSPTVNINSFHQAFEQAPELYLQLQRDVEQLMAELLQQAAAAGLADSFFIHYAPNLGRDAQGERIKYAQGPDAGTTDFQFMLRGAIKEVGVLVLLNHYYQQQTGQYPLGADFNARQAPHEHEALLELARRHLDPALMPRIIGIGDTVTAIPQAQGEPLRGGSDRGFLTLVQELGTTFGTDNAVLYIDSSRGEVRRPGIQLPADRQQPLSFEALHNITDPADPLQLNFLFPQGHPQYIDFFAELAARRQNR